MLVSCGGGIVGAYRGTIELRVFFFFCGFQFGAQALESSAWSLELCGDGTVYNASSLIWFDLKNTSIQNTDPYCACFFFFFLR